MDMPQPFFINSTINLKQYIPSTIHNYKYYAIFKCTVCGFVEFFVYNIKNEKNNKKKIDINEIGI
jgi:predicted nucleic-acid-binding Zn-ribbon protein